MTPYYPQQPPSHEHNKFDDIDPRVVDDLLSKELLQLSFKDRNAIDEEIHGVHTLARDETPELIDVELTRLAIELNLLVSRPNTMSNTGDGDSSSSSSSSSLVIAYQKSQQLISQGGGDNTNTTTYVNTDNFRLRFLRCEFFNAKKAAIRMCKFLNALYEFYGDYALQRPIQIHDFSKSELQLLKTGQIQIFPYRDKSGRPICCWVGDFTLSSSNTKERVRSLFDFSIPILSLLLLLLLLLLFLVPHISNTTSTSLYFPPCCFHIVDENCFIFILCNV